MTRHDYSRYYWKENQLCLGKRKLGIYLVPDATYPNMWRIGKKVKTEILSKDFYNLTRAKDNAVKWHQESASRTVENGSRSLADALF